MSIKETARQLYHGMNQPMDVIASPGSSGGEEVSGLQALILNQLVAGTARRDAGGNVTTSVPNFALRAIGNGVWNEDSAPPRVETRQPVETDAANQMLNMLLAAAAGGNERPAGVSRKGGKSVKDIVKAALGATVMGVLPIIKGVERNLTKSPLEYLSPEALEAYKILGISKQQRLSLSPEHTAQLEKVAELTAFGVWTQRNVLVDKTGKIKDMMPTQEEVSLAAKVVEQAAGESGLFNIDVGTIQRDIDEKSLDASKKMIRDTIFSRFSHWENVRAGLLSAKMMEDKKLPDGSLYLPLIHVGPWTAIVSSILLGGKGFMGAVGSLVTNQAGRRGYDLVLAQDAAGMTGVQLLSGAEMNPQNKILLAKADPHAWEPLVWKWISDTPLGFRLRKIWRVKNIPEVFMLRIENQESREEVFELPMAVHFPGETIEQQKAKPMAGGAVSFLYALSGVLGATRKADEYLKTTKKPFLGVPDGQSWSYGEAVSDAKDKVLTEGPRRYVVGELAVRMLEGMKEQPLKIQQVARDLRGESREARKRISHIQREIVKKPTKEQKLNAWNQFAPEVMGLVTQIEGRAAQIASVRPYLEDVGLARSSVSHRSSSETAPVISTDVSTPTSPQPERVSIAMKILEGARLTGQNWRNRKNSNRPNRV
ncbi:hypothetical protein KKE34_01960 [Patescibacteria group bacterium]|nr:hypothetical protein [Patescibacteria group bacterium]MBU1885350.1 hypothetical protein [Patescibacteria group bacterium]